MGRKPYFERDDFINAALDIVSETGPGSLTIAALAARTRAPVGSVYHRFSSREVLLAELWVRIAESFQQGFLAALSRDGLEAALYTARWARGHLNEGRVLLLYRREELVAGNRPQDVKEHAANIARELEKGLVSFTKRHFGSANKENLRRAVFALIDVPLAAVKTHLQKGERPPQFLDDLIRKSFGAVMKGDMK